MAKRLLFVALLLGLAGAGYMKTSVVGGGDPPPSCGLKVCK
jgi:hypothetical protein